MFRPWCRLKVCRSLVVSQIIYIHGMELGLQPGRYWTVKGPTDINICNCKFVCLHKQSWYGSLWFVEGIVTETRTARDILQCKNQPVGALLDFVTMTPFLNDLKPRLAFLFWNFSSLIRRHKHRHRYQQQAAREAKLRIQTFFAQNQTALELLIVSHDHPRPVTKTDLGEISRIKNEPSIRNLFKVTIFFMKQRDALIRVTRLCFTKVKWHLGVIHLKHSRWCFYLFI